MHVRGEGNPTNKSVIWMQHFRFGHPAFSVLQIMFPDLFKDINKDDFQCICELAKHKRASHPRSDSKCKKHFDLIHWDIWGPSRIPNITGAKWFATFIDDCTRVTWVFLLKNKSDMSIILPNFQKMIETQFGEQIKRF